MSIDTLNSARISTTLNWDAIDNVLFEKVASQVNWQSQISFSLGDEADKINTIAAQIVTVEPGSPEDVDIVGGLTDIFNSTNQSMTTVRGLYIRLLKSTDTDSDGTVIGTACDSVTVGGASSDFMETVLGASNVGMTLNNGDDFLFTNRGDGWTAGPTDGDNIRFSNDDATEDAKVLLILFGAE